MNEIESALDSVYDFPEPQRSAVLASFTEIVLYKLSERLEAVLRPGEITQLEQMAEAENEEIFHFLRSKVANFDEMLESVIAEEMVELTNNLGTALRKIKDK